MAYDSLLVATPSSTFDIVTVSTDYNDGGANCFIKNDLSHFTSYISKPIYVNQLNGSTIKALGYGLKLIQCPKSMTIIPLGPSFFKPTNPQFTFSPTALCHYLHYKITTEHLACHSIVTSSGDTLKFPSIQHNINNQLLDYHLFNVVKPKEPTASNIGISNRQQYY